MLCVVVLMNDLNLIYQIENNIYVSVNGCGFNLADGKFGVPQASGSVLGPLLFLICINY